MKALREPLRVPSSVEVASGPLSICLDTAVRTYGHTRPMRSTKRRVLTLQTLVKRFRRGSGICSAVAGQWVDSVSLRSLALDPVVTNSVLTKRSCQHRHPPSRAAVRKRTFCVSGYCLLSSLSLCGFTNAHCREVLKTNLNSKTVPDRNDG